ncbi:MAG: hypothetical protein AAF570_24240 [Bacteroidota bacterium]
MGTRLIDSNKAFRPVYAIYQHEYLGCLISAHVVQELDNGRLSLKHQGLYPESYKQFSSRLDDTDRRLINMLSKISSTAVFKKFNGRSKTEMDFYLTKFDGELKKTVKLLSKIVCD